MTSPHTPPVSTPKTSTSSPTASPTASPPPTIQHVKKLDQGKQGITGLAEHNGQLCVYKISQYMNYLTNHEYLILKGLSSVIPYCPHFCNVVDLCTVAIHPNFREADQNPFETHTHPIYLDVLFMEYITESIPLYNLIREPSVPIDHILSCVKQVLLSVIIAQKEKRFVHYDLHSLNVLIRDSSIHDVYLYVLDEQNVFVVPSYGYNSVVIDFGFSYSSDLNQNPSYLSLAYTDAGYMSPAYDSIADAKVFLVSLAEDLKECRIKSTQATKFRNIVRNLFAPLKLVWTSGWDKTEEMSIVDRIFKYIENPKEQSELFRMFPHMCLDILHSLIQLPFTSQSNGTLDDLEKAYRTVVTAFEPIETEVNDTFYSLYAFRKLVDVARQVRPQYYVPETRQEAVAYFANEFMTQIKKSISFCMFRHVQFDVLLCALYAFGEQLEVQLARMLNSFIARKVKQYQKLDLQCVEHMYSVVAMNFDDSYVFSERSIIHILDVPNKQETIMECSECETSLLQELNELPQHSRGAFLYQFYKSLGGSPT
jgi:hypothetical protein